MAELKNLEEIQSEIIPNLLDSDLLQNQYLEDVNLSQARKLPLECEVLYYPNFIPFDLRDELFSKFSNEFEWEVRKAKTATSENKYKLNRATCVFGDDEVVAPEIWGDNAVVNKWTPELMTLKTQIESLTGKKYNICLCNYYKNGKHSIGFHSDNEERGSTSSIASISLGAKRPFIFRKIVQPEERYTHILDHGSLLIMGEGCQETYQHTVPIDKTMKDPRVNLTFRLFDAERYGIKDD